MAKPKLIDARKYILAGFTGDFPNIGEGRTAKEICKNYLGSVGNALLIDKNRKDATSDIFKVPIEEEVRVIEICLTTIFDFEFRNFTGLDFLGSMQNETLENAGQATFLGKFYGLTDEAWNSLTAITKARIFAFVGFKNVHQLDDGEPLMSIERAMNTYGVSATGYNATKIPIKWEEGQFIVENKSPWTVMIKDGFLRPRKGETESTDTDDLSALIVSGK